MRLLPVTGKVEIKSGDRVLASGKNLVVDGGLELLAQLILGETDAVLPNLFKLGDDGRASGSSMTALQGTVLQSWSVTASREGRQLTWLGSYTYTGENVTVRELGIFNSTTMLARFLPSPAFDLKTNSPISINWTITIGD